jgi:hypothetical protein
VARPRSSCAPREDRLATPEIGPVHDHLAVEAPRPQQRRIQDLRPVRGRHQDHGRAGVEAVELREELVQGLLALVVGRDSPEPAAGPADRVDLVDEHDARRALARLLEELPHPRGPEPHEHLDELARVQREEGHVRLSRDGAREQRLAGPGRPDEQEPPRNAAPEAPVPGGLLEIVDDLDELVLGLLDARHVGEADRILPGSVVDLRAAPARAGSQLRCWVVR